MIAGGSCLGSEAAAKLKNRINSSLSLQVAPWQPPARLPHTACLLGGIFRLAEAAGQVVCGLCSVQALFWPCCAPRNDSSGAGVMHPS